MDSIDVYLEKKRKRMEGFNQSVKRAKVGELRQGTPKQLLQSCSNIMGMFATINSAAGIVESLQPLSIW